jgi:hypothetical protein
MSSKEKADGFQGSVIAYKAFRYCTDVGRTDNRQTALTGIENRLVQIPQNSVIDFVVDGQEGCLAIGDYSSRLQGN